MIFWFAQNRKILGSTFIISRVSALMALTLLEKKLLQTCLLRWHRYLLYLCEVEVSSLLVR